MRMKLISTSSPLYWKILKQKLLKSCFYHVLAQQCSALVTKVDASATLGAFATIKGALVTKSRLRGAESKLEQL